MILINECREGKRIKVHKSEFSGLWLVFFGAVFWSLNAPLIKVTELNPILVCGLRSAIAGIVLAPFCLPAGENVVAQVELTQQGQGFVDAVTQLLQGVGIGAHGEDAHARLCRQLQDLPGGMEFRQAPAAAGSVDFQPHPPAGHLGQNGLDGPAVKGQDCRAVVLEPIAQVNIHVGEAVKKPAATSSRSREKYSCRSWARLFWWK